MLVSTPLNSIPFLSNSDSTRLQMSAKQLAQTLTCSNTRRPYVIGSDWPYVSETSELFKKVAPSDGEVIYSNPDLMVVVVEHKGKGRVEVYNTPPVMETANSFASSLRFRRDLGPFNKDDIIYEYDCFTENVPSYGYNVNTLFMPFFGYNFEDAVIISESLAKKARAIKYKKLYVTVRFSDLYKFIYPDSKYGFIPEIGQTIKGNVIVSQLVTRQNLNNHSYGDAIDEDLQMSANSLLCRLENAEVVNIKIHKIDNSKSKQILDKALDEAIYKIKEDYAIKIRTYSQDFKECVGPMAVSLLTSNYIMQNTKSLDMNLDDLAYVIELELKKEYPSKIGDKFANRFANKGVTNMILPDHLCPVNIKTGERIDVILGPLGIYSRMNFGQIAEAIIAKGIKKSEEEILKDPLINTDKYLDKLSNLAKELGQDQYSEDILNLKGRSKELVESIKQGGLFFEAPSFTKINVQKLRSFVENEFEIEISESIRIPRETFIYMKDKLQVDMPIPDKDLVYGKVFSSNIYLLKLMQIAESKLTARDFGSYSSSTRMPLKDREGNNTGSRLGGMEFDGLISHNIPTVINELRTVKSDCIDLKKDLVNKMLQDGEYTMPTTDRHSYTKQVIDTLITFLNN